MAEPENPAPEPSMDRDLDLARVVFETLRRTPLTLEELGDLLGVSPSTLSRWGCPHDENTSPRPLPLCRVLSLMKATGDYAILRHLARRSGFDLVRPSGRVRARAQADLPLLTRVMGEAGWAAAEAWLDPRDELKRRRATHALTALIEEAAGHRKALEKGLAQEELGL